MLHELTPLALPQGVIVYFRVTDGTMKPGDTVKLMNTKVEHEVLDMGVLAPKPVLVRHCR